MTNFKDPRGSAPPTSQPRPTGGIVVRPSAHIARGQIDPTILFGKLGLPLHDMGWNVLPQTQGVDDSKRQPGRTMERPGNGWARKLISYKTQWQMHLQMAPREQVQRWVGESFHNKNLNVALVTGDSPGTHGIIAIDGDVLAPCLAAQAWELLDRIAGRTPLMRGRPGSSKAALAP